MNSNLTECFTSERQQKWDRRFLRLAQFKANEMSKDPSTKCGSIIVRPDFTEAASGVNGFPRKMADHPEWLNDREEKYSRVIHAEMNALFFAREPLDGYTLYVYPMLPCDRCSVGIIQKGITRVVSVELQPDQQDRWAAQIDKTRQYFNECGVTHKTYPYAKIFGE